MWNKEWFDIIWWQDKILMFNQNDQAKTSNYKKVAHLSQIRSSFGNFLCTIFNLKLQLKRMERLIERIENERNRENGSVNHSRKIKRF